MGGPGNGRRKNTGVLCSMNGRSFTVALLDTGRREGGRVTSQLELLQNSPLTTVCRKGDDLVHARCGGILTPLRLSFEKEIQLWCMKCPETVYMPLVCLNRISRMPGAG